MANLYKELNRKHGLLILVVSVLAFISLLLLSMGWVDSYSLMVNLDRIYIFKLGEGRRGIGGGYDPETFFRTKYFLVLALSLMGYGFLIYSSVLNSPFRRFSKELKDKRDP